MVSNRYKAVEAILDNVLRFNDGQLNRQMLCEQMYHGIRTDVLKEINAFASEYGHLIDGRDVVIVEQLIDFIGGKHD
jgi:hypothetical protein